MLPSNPTVNQIYSVGSRIYVYDGDRWVVTGGVSPSVPTTPTVPPDNTLIPDDDEATDREKLLSFGSRLYTLEPNKWIITTPLTQQTFSGGSGGVGPQGPAGPQGPQGVPGGGGSDPNLQSQIDDILDKIVSIDDRLDGIPTDLSGYVKLEENTVPGVQSIETTPQFFDNVPDGDVNVFTVGIDERGVYTLEGVPQPTVEVPVPDLIVFDLSQLPEDDYENFDVYKNGVELDHGILREYDEKRITVYTAQISTDITRLFYKNKIKKGMGFVISIIRY